MNLSKRTKLIRHSAAVAAGTSVITPGSGVDCQGFRSCRFIASFGTIVAGAATSVEVHQSSDDGSSDSYTALLGSKITVADDDDNKLVAVDIVAPRERYLKLVVNRATQDATLDGIVAELYDPSEIPTTDDSSTVVDQETHIAPAEGTA